MGVKGEEKNYVIPVQSIGVTIHQSQNQAMSTWPVVLKALYCYTTKNAKITHPEDKDNIVSSKELVEEEKGYAKDEQT